MNDKEREMLTDTIGRVRALEIQVSALNETIIALAIALAEKTKTPLADTATILEIIRNCVRHQKGSDISDLMGGTTNYLFALSKTADVSPLEQIVIISQLYQQAGDKHLKALRTWITQAHPDEIAEELRQSLLRSLSEQEHPNPDQDDAL
jgi:hypothetical protein